MIKHKNYKEILFSLYMEKKGQASIFIIIGIFIVAVAILAYIFFPRIQEVVSGEISPSSSIESCVSESVKENIDILSRQGGYLEPEGFIEYRGDKVKYLCYTSEYYLPCKVQQALIKKKYEDELKKGINGKVEECILGLREQFERRGYDLSPHLSPETNVEIIPGRIRVAINYPLTVTKDSSQSYNGFDVEYSSNMYNLLLISLSIIDFESVYGNSETSLYTANYPNIRIEKMELGDGSTIYTVSDVTSEDSFRFASRGLAWPGGYGSVAP